ncbi:MAG: hypothetical protein R6U40_10095, partial [Desulfobacterales bacterium]
TEHRPVQGLKQVVEAAAAIAYLGLTVHGEAGGAQLPSIAVDVLDGVMTQRPRGPNECPCCKSKALSNFKYQPGRPCLALFLFYKWEWQVRP